MTSKWNFSKDMKPIEDDILEVGFFKGTQNTKIKVSADLLRSVMNLDKDASIKNIDEIAYHFLLSPNILQPEDNPNYGKAETLNQKLIMEAIDSFIHEQKDLKDEQSSILSFDNIDHYLGKAVGFAKTAINSNFNKYNIEIQ